MQAEQETFIDEDYELAEAHQLGSPLFCYRLTSFYARFVYGCSISLIVIGVLSILAFLLIAWYDHQLSLAIQQGDPSAVSTSMDPQARQQSLDWDVRSILIIHLPFTCIMVVLFCLSLYRDRLQLRHNRILLCEQGLLQVTWMWKRAKVTVVRWEDIHLIGQELIGSGYYLVRRTGKSLTLKYYQDMEDLIAQIREMSGCLLE